MIETLKEGQKVVVDIDCLKEDHGIEVGHPFKDMTTVTSVFKKTGSSGRILVETHAEDNGLELQMRESPAMDYLPKDAISLSSCQRCDSDLTFHDRRQEWICLFCDLE